ncbi:PEP-CTERM sorting domain-containing protein [Parahaliea mediterranea]|uniref:PEP-CTERM sorting domain-containing protein n=1 Tax=Parahaliea mediterranea TaxID=651086 RepID=UPI001F49AC84|nr:PEP-CTERM sorting domain-containing protein [Parahaliea mediterranea]
MNKTAGMLAILIFGALANSASAGLVSYSDTNVGAPLWNGYNMDLQPFYVDTDGFYSMQTTAANFDTYMFLFPGTPSFPADAGSYLALNDDGGVGLLSLINFALESNTQYTLGVRGFAGATGNFTARIQGVGGITLGEVEAAPVPVPATLALFGLGLVGLGWSARKKA